MHQWSLQTGPSDWPGTSQRVMGGYMVGRPLWRAPEEVTQVM